MLAEGVLAAIGNRDAKRGLLLRMRLWGCVSFLTI